MTKIYNEIVIDMNPESSTYEDILYEDSFQYNGDMDLAQDASDPNWQAGASWGAENITTDMFMKPDGTPKSRGEIYASLDPILTGITSTDLYNWIDEILPKVKEGSFADSLAGQGAGVTLSSQLSGMQAELEDAAVSSQGTDVGAGQRRQITQTGRTKTAVDTLYKGYDLEKKSFIKGRGEDYLTDVKGTFGEDFFVAPGEEGKVTPGGPLTPEEVEDAKKQRALDAAEAMGVDRNTALNAIETGDYGLAETVASGIGETVKSSVTGTISYLGDWASSLWKTSGSYKEGGKVPGKKETFLDFLQQLPDAGGS